MKKSWKRLRYRAGERWGDWRWRIRSYDYLTPAQLGLGSNSEAYSPTPYSELRFLLRKAPQGLRQGALMDMGCGMGRTLILAQRMGFRRAIGVELSERLCAVARANTAGLPIEIVQGDAGGCAIPADVTVFYLFNPFNGETLRQVLDHIAEHGRAHPSLLLVHTCRNFAPAAQEHPEIRVRRQGQFHGWVPSDWAVCTVGAETTAGLVA